MALHQVEVFGSRHQIMGRFGDVPSRSESCAPSGNRFMETLVSLSAQFVCPKGKNTQLFLQESKNWGVNSKLNVHSQSCAVDLVTMSCSKYTSCNKTSETNLCAFPACQNSGLGCNRPEFFSCLDSSPVMHLKTYQPLATQMHNQKLCLGALHAV